MTERTIIKNIETRVMFTNDDVRDLLQKAAGAPEGAKGAVYFDEETFYGDLEIVWWEKTEESAS